MGEEDKPQRMIKGGLEGEGKGTKEKAPADVRKQEGKRKEVVEYRQFRFMGESH